MKIAMIGCGAAGSCFAGYLRKGGADITLVDMYKAHMDKIATDGLEFIVYPDTHYHLDGFKTAYSADEIGIMDIVIFVTKATQLDKAVQSAMPCIGPDTVVVSLINGLGNDDILLKHFPANRILCGSGALGTELREPGCCVSTEVVGTLVHFGALENGPVTDRAGAHLAEVFTKGGCRAEFNEDDRPNVWKKVIINSTVNTVCALLRLKIFEVAEDPYGMELFRGVVREACAIATAKGVPFDAVEFEHTSEELYRQHGRLLSLHGPGHADQPPSDRDRCAQRQALRVRPPVWYPHPGQRSAYRDGQGNPGQLRQAVSYINASFSALFCRPAFVGRQSLSFPKLGP